MKVKRLVVALSLALSILVYGTGVNSAQVSSVSIDEYWYSTPGPYIGEDGYFDVHNNSVENIFCIVIAGDQFDSPGFHPQDPPPEEGQRWYNWIGATVVRVEWEAGFDFSLGADTVTYWDSESQLSWSPPNTSDFDWAYYFGNESSALMYWTGVEYGYDTDGDGVPDQGEHYFGALEPGGSYDGFLFLAAGPASPFLAFGSDGSTILDSGETTIVPIPGTVWLLGSSLIGLVAVRRGFTKS